MIAALAVLGLAGCGPVELPIVVNPHATGGGTCAGVYERGCLPGEFCDLEVGQCHVQMIAGVCVPQPEICTRDYRPVCGCNGTTYGNDCSRISAGVQKAHNGECRASTCDGKAKDCPHQCAKGMKGPCQHGKGSCPHAKRGCPDDMQGCPHAKQGCPHEQLN